MIFIIYTDYITGINCENSLVCIAICEIFGIIAASFCFEVSFTGLVSGRSIMKWVVSSAGRAPHF